MRIEWLVFVVTAIVVFSVYFFTSAPGLGLVDSGELTIVAKTLGIAHPTGYPLYTLLGRVWLILAPMSPARAMVLFSVVCGAMACGVLSVIAWKVLSAFTELPVKLAAVAAIALTTAFAFSASIWSSVAFAEVYPLTVLIAASLLSITMFHWQSGSASPIRAAALACYLWGLGFGNHFTILWFFPVVVWMVVRGITCSPRRTKSFVIFATAFLLGGSINLFLPIRSSVDPLLDWSDPETLPNLFRHLSAWQYRVWMFKGDAAGFLNNFVSYLGTVPHDIGWPLVILVVLGVVRAIIVRSSVMLVCLLVWLLGVAYNLNYSIPDISSYFTSFYAPLFALSIFGFLTVVRIVRKMRIPAKYQSALILLLALVPATIALGSSVREANRSHDTFATDHALAILETLPDSAVIFQGNWDIQSPFIYLQRVEGVRTDLVMLDLALMQRPWYIKQERRNHREIFAPCEGKVSAFLLAVAPFEAGKQYDGAQLEAAFVGMINCMIENLYRTRPVYVRDTRAVGHPGIAADFVSVPGGYFFRVTDHPVIEPTFEATRLLRTNSIRDDRVKHLLREAAMSAAMQGTFAMETRDSVTVRAALRNASLLAPDDPAIQRFAAQARSFLSAKAIAP